MLPLSQRLFFYSVAGLFLLLVVLLIRQKRLRENYSLLWLFVPLMLILITSQYQLLAKVADLLQATPTSLLMFLGMVALLLMVLQLCLMTSGLATQLKNLVQKVAMLEHELDKIKQAKK